MIGWLADFLRLAWGLLYWNSRKTVFRIRKGRGRCPCQSPSDSGRAYETQCEASLTWARQDRFMRVCPLLVRTPKGLRCAADTADVRPFWLRAAGYYGGTFAAIYLSGAIAVFTALRIIGYPISIVHVTWPGLWYRVPQARGGFFLARSERAMAQGRINEGLLYLSNAYEFDPTNETVAVRLAQTYQAANPVLSDEVYEKLIADHPDQKNMISAAWFRPLLARGNFVLVRKLAQTQLLADPRNENAWMRALIVSTRELKDDQTLRTLLANPAAIKAGWRPVLETELALRSGDTARARALVTAQWAPPVPAYAQFYRIDQIRALGDPVGALDELAVHQREFDLETEQMLGLAILADGHADHGIQSEAAKIVGEPARPAGVRVVAIHLIRHPNHALLEWVFDRTEAAAWPVGRESVDAWESLLWAAGSAGDRYRFRTLAAQLRQRKAAAPSVLNGIDGFLNSESGSRRITTYLPWMQMPVELEYALLERFPLPVPKVHHSL